MSSVSNQSGDQGTVVSVQRSRIGRGCVYIATSQNGGQVFANNIRL